MIRSATVQDALGIAETHVSSWQATYQGMVPDVFLAGLSVPEREKSWQRRFASSAGATFVVEKSGSIVGFADFGPTRDKDKNPATTGELYAIYLRPENQGTGFGTELFEEGKAWLKDGGFSEFTTLVLEDNKRARDFYLKMGMIEDGFKVPDNIGGKDVIEVRLVLRL